MKTKYIIIGKRGNLAKAIMKVLEASHGTNSFIGLSFKEVISYLKQNIYSTHQYSITNLADKVKLHFNKEIDMEGNLDLPEETVILNSVKSTISEETKWNPLENYQISSYPKTS